MALYKRRSGKPARTDEGDKTFLRLSERFDKKLVIKADNLAKQEGSQLLPRHYKKAFRDLLEGVPKSPKRRELDIRSIVSIIAVLLLAIPIAQLLNDNDLPGWLLVIFFVVPCMLLLWSERRRVS